MALRWLLSTLVLTFFVVPFIASAEPVPGQGAPMPGGPPQEFLQNMSPEERGAFEDKMRQRREQWEKMTPEQKKAVEEEMKKRRDEWEKMTPEQREKMLKEMKDRRAMMPSMMRGGGMMDLSPDDHLAFEEYMRQSRERWEKLTPEERKKLAEEGKARREKMMRERPMPSQQGAPPPQSKEGTPPAIPPAGTAKP